MMRMLVAEDSPSAMKMMISVLSRQGHDIVSATNGQDALEILESSDAPNLAILDWLMPNIDGIDVCRQIRQSAKTSLPYIVMITAKSERDALVGAFDAGADDFITKPYNVEELICRIRAGVRIVDLHTKNTAYMLQLQHHQKMESIGQLAAGVAHEINTPAQYIGDNSRFLDDSFKDVLSLLEQYGQLEQLAIENKWALELTTTLSNTKDDVDLPFLMDEIPHAITQCIQGIDTISRIVAALKEFSHPGSETKTPNDIHRVLKNTIAVSKNEWKYVAELETDFDSSIPLVSCIPSDIGQALINIIVNAGHAIEHRKKAEPNAPGLIRVSTRRESDNVLISISDTGAGIPEDIQNRVFDPFFTTKEVGKGTGQGLAIAYDIVVKRHGGIIEFDSDSKGTVFRIALPLEEPPPRDESDG